MACENFHSSNLGYEMYDSLQVSSVSHATLGKDGAAMPVSPNYFVILVVKGEGKLKSTRYDEKISEGDIIFCPPAVSVSFYGEGMKFIKISVGGREMMSFADRLGFSRSIKIFYGFTSVIPLWLEIIGLDFAAEILRAKALIYYTVSELCKSGGVRANSKNVYSAAEQIKNYADNNFTNPDISLKSIGDALSYHPNYVSRCFNSSYGISVVKYINVLRVRYAVFLMGQGFESVKELSSMCGFVDENYFSSVFKAQVGETPREHMKRFRNYGTIL